MGINADSKIFLCVFLFLLLQSIQLSKCCSSKRKYILQPVLYPIIQITYFKIVSCKILINVQICYNARIQSSRRIGVFSMYQVEYIESDWQYFYCIIRSFNSQSFIYLICSIKHNLSKDESTVATEKPTTATTPTHGMFWFSLHQY